MDGKNKIIHQIIADADSKCKSIIAKGQEDAKAILDHARSKIASDREALDIKLADSSHSIVANALSNAELDLRKYTLSSKQGLIDQVYNKALHKLMSLSDNDYVELIISLLTKYAEEGEVVSICSRDSKRITQFVIDKAQKKLMLSPGYVDIDGGVILSTSGYDKVLTLSMLVSQARDATDGQVAKILFEVD